MQRTKKSFAYRVSKFLPSLDVQDSVRKKAPDPCKIPGDVEFKIAEDCFELEKAFHLLYQGRLKNYREYQKNRLHVTKYNAVPGTIVLIAKSNETVLATATLIPDSSLGLPIEALCDLSEIRRNTLRLYELGELVVEPSLLKKREQLLIPLVRFAYQFAQGFLRCDTLLLNSRKKMAPLYEAFFFFSPIQNSKGVKIETHQPLFTKVDFHSLREWHEKLAKRRASNEMADHFFKTEIPQFYFPKPRSFDSEFGRMSSSLLNYFFNEKTQAAKDMTILEKINLERSYKMGEGYKNVFVRDLVDLESNRRFNRFNVSCQAKVFSPKKPMGEEVAVMDVSKKGLRISSRGLKLDEVELMLEVETGGDLPVKLVGKLAWQDSYSRHGIEIVEHSLPWFYFVENIHKSLEAEQ